MVWRWLSIRLRKKDWPILGWLDMRNRSKLRIQKFLRLKRLWVWFKRMSFWRLPRNNWGLERRSWLQVRGKGSKEWVWIMKPKYFLVYIEYNFLIKLEEFFVPESFPYDLHFDEFYEQNKDDRKDGHFA